MVVGHLGIVHQTADSRPVRCIGEKGQNFRQISKQRLNCTCHILRDILAVCPGVGHEFTLIQFLKGVQRFLGRVAKIAVCLPLQGGQVIEPGRFGCFLCFLQFGHSGRFALADLYKVFCIGFFLDYVRSDRQPVTAQRYLIIGFPHKTVDFMLAFHQHSQGRSLHPPDHQTLKVFGGIGPCGVHSHQPIGAGTALRRLEEIVIGPTVLQVCKPFPNRCILHAGNPKPFDRGFTPCQGIHPAEDGFTLAPGIAGIDDVFKIRPVHQDGKHLKLFLFRFCHRKLPGFRDDGQILIVPTLILFVIDLWLHIFCQVAQTPTDQIPVALKIALFTVGRADHFGQAARYTGLFRDH